MLRCSYGIGSYEFMDEAICGTRIPAGQLVCSECGGDFCSQHLTACALCGETLCVRCSPFHAKVCAFNEVEAA